MPVVKVSSRYQITIPKEIRERNHFKPGMKFEVSIVGNHIIRLVPVRPAREMMGFMAGYDAMFKREETDRY